MAVRSSGYFNNPAFAQAASNLTALFAPPSGSDAAGWASANAKKEEAARLAYLFDNPTDEHFDRRNIAAGNYAPTQSFYAQDQNNATQRYGIDTTAATSRSNNAADNVRALTEREMQEAAAMDRLGITDATSRYDIDTDANTALATNAADNARALQVGKLGGLAGFYDALSPGQIRPELPPEIASQFGVGAVPAAQGLEKPLSETELAAQQQQRLMETGQLTDDMLLDGIMGERTPVQAVGPEGAPVYMSPGAAVRGGAQPFINKGAEAKPTNGMAVVNGQEVAVVQAQDGTWREAQTGAPIPSSIPVYGMPQPTGSAEDVGLTKAVQSDVQKTIISLDNTMETASTLRELIAQNPSSQGAVGGVRRFAQNLFQTANELGQMGAGMAEVTDAVRQGTLDSGVASEMFDPTLPDISLLANYLAWQYAKSMSGDRVSNEQLKQAKEAIGGESLFSNQADSLARLDRLIQQLGSQRQRYGTMAPGLASPAAAPGAAPAAPTQRMRFDADGNPL